MRTLRGRAPGGGFGAPAGPSAGTAASAIGAPPPPVVRANGQVGEERDEKEREREARARI